MVTTEILIVLILIVLNAFFSLSEMAIVSASRPMLRQLAKQGDRRAAVALGLAEDSGRFLSTVQVGITLVGILAGTYGGARIAGKIEHLFKDMPFFGHHSEAIALFLVVTAITYLSVVVGELIPKQFALRRPDRLALLVARPMLALSRFCTPVVWTLEMSANAISRIFTGGTLSEERITEAEVKAVLSEGAETGVFEKSEHEMLQRVIRLGDRDIKSIMTHRSSVTFISLGDSMDEIREKIRQCGHSRYPVTDGNPDKVIGILQAKELLAGALSHASIEVKDFVQPVESLPENASCLLALDMFKHSALHLAIVVNEYGSTEGIVTLSDLLEAIVGVLPSNYDTPEHALITERQDGSWFVDGLTPIDEIHLSIGLEEIKPDGSFETIAGFMLEHLRKSPEEGDYFELHAHRFEIADMDDARIDKIIVTRIEDDSGARDEGDKTRL